MALNWRFKKKTSDIVNQIEVFTKAIKCYSDILTDHNMEINKISISYNAEEILKLIKELKQRYEDKV